MCDTHPQLFNLITTTLVLTHSHTHAFPFRFSSISYNTNIYRTQALIKSNNLTLNRFSLHKYFSTTNIYMFLLSYYCYYSLSHTISATPPSIISFFSLLSWCLWNFSISLDSFHCGWPFFLRVLVIKYCYTINRTQLW